MTIRNRIERLESAVLPTNSTPVMTEAEFDDLDCESKILYLRGQLDLRVVSEDDGPTWEEHLASRGVDHAGAAAEATAGRSSPAVLRAYGAFMDGCMERWAARRAARTAAKARAAGFRSIED